MWRTGRGVDGGVGDGVEKREIVLLTVSLS